MSTIRIAVCIFWALFSRTLLISQRSASVVLRPAREPCWPGCHHPLVSPWIDRCIVTAFSTNFAIVGNSEIQRYDFTLVLSRLPGFGITTTLANFNSAGRPVLTRWLINSHSPRGSSKNHNLSSCHPIPSSPGADELLVFLSRRFNSFGQTVNFVSFVSI
jgi:hypothetical protein